MPPLHASTTSAASTRAASKPSPSIPRTKSRALARGASPDQPSALSKLRDDYPELLGRLHEVVAELGEIDVRPTEPSKYAHGPHRLKVAGYVAHHPVLASRIDLVLGEIDDIINSGSDDVAGPTDPRCREWLEYHDQLCRARGSLIRAIVGDEAVEDELAGALQELRSHHAKNYSAIRQAVFETMVSADPDGVDGTFHTDAIR